MKIIQVEKPYSWLQYAVKLKGNDEPRLHLTVKFFGYADINPGIVSLIAQDEDQGLFRTDEFSWQPAIFNDVIHVLQFTKMPVQIVKLHDRFDLIKNQFSPWRPHLKVHRSYWDRVVRECLTPEQESITIGNLELCLGREDVP